MIWLGPFKLPSIQFPSIHFPSIATPVATGFIAGVVKWAGYIAAFATLVHLPFQISRWRGVRRVYGRIPWSLVWQTGVYSFKNRMLRIQSLLMCLMFLWVVPAFIVNLIGADILGMIRPLDEFARSQMMYCLFMLAWQTDRVVGYLLPPTGLLLGTAKSANVHLIGVLHRRLSPYRVVSLLDLNEHIFPPFVFAVMYNNLRTVNGHEWRTIVHHLMDVVPLLIVDKAVRTEYVDAELHRIERFGYDYKVVSFSSAAYGKEINALESGIGDVVDAAQKLGDELAPRILERLENPLDIARRLKAQREYNAMIRSVPRQFRFHSDINGMLIKAHYILAWTMENYLRNCKQTVPDGHSSWLLEDIPSSVTPDEEEEYLRQSRGLDEVRGIALSALDLARETPGPQQTFNIANAHNKIGKCARFSRDWKTALEHLGAAVEQFTQMTNGITPESRRKVQQELADSHFLRGEVHMACYRQTASISDRDHAESDFRASMSLDEQLGQDSSVTEFRIQKLHR